MRKAYFWLTKIPTLKEWIGAGEREPRLTRRGIIDLCTNQKNARWCRLTEDECEKMLSGAIIVRKVNGRGVTYEVKHRIVEIEWRFVEDD